MSARPWLELGDELLIDGVDFRVIARLLVRSDRMRLQHLALQPQLGGENRNLLQLEETIMEAHPVEPELLEGPEAQVSGETFKLGWEAAARTERSTLGTTPKFGNGRCAWYHAEDGAVALLVVERYESSAIVGRPLAAARIDLRFTEGLRKRRS